MVILVAGNDPAGAGAGFGKLIRIGSRPHRGSAFVIVHRQVGGAHFRHPLPELPISGEQRPPLIQRRAIGQPALDLLTGFRIYINLC